MTPDEQLDDFFSTDDAPAAPRSPFQGTPQEERDIRALVRSRAWRWIKAYLLYRREALFAADVGDSTNKLWSNKGAIQEINQLLRSPTLMLALYTQARKAGMAAAPDVSAPADPGTAAALIGAHTVHADDT